MKKWFLLTAAFMFLALPMASFGEMGQMTPKSKDIDVNFFGSLKCYPTFMDDIDFNRDSTSKDFIIDENGLMAEHDIRSEVRIGWTGKAEKFDFLVVLESDFNMTKANADRGADISQIMDSGMNGGDFGVEKLNLRYDFGDFAVKAGWNSRFLDVMTGGVLYGDDHPYIGLEGKSGDFSWEALYITVQDEVYATTPHSSDWRVYTLKGIFKTKVDNNDFNISPFYAYSNDNAHEARVHYFGAEAYGKIDKLTPRFEAVYALGDMDTAGGTSYDISAWAAYGSVEFEASKECIPYLGVTYMTGDDNANDKDIKAFNGITNISRYTPTFGMENALIYRYVPALGSHLYSNNFATLGSGSGYGGISNSSKGDSPGLISYGLGCKGTSGKLFYKAQVLFMQFEEAGGLESLGTYSGGSNIDNAVGTEYDLLLTYKYSKHFSLGNCFAYFDPGDAIRDLWGNDYDDAAILNTVELQWVW